MKGPLAGNNLHYVLIVIEGIAIAEMSVANRREDRLSNLLAIAIKEAPKVLVIMLIGRPGFAKDRKK